MDDYDFKKLRELKICMIFGDIEIWVMVVDILFGKEVKVSINFLLG